LTGNVCIETNPADVDNQTAQRLKDMGIELVSLGVQSFRADMLAVLGRDYEPIVAERALAILAGNNFASQRRYHVCLTRTDSIGRDRRLITGSTAWR